ncbi:hypothetical protein Glove_41g48 [Diversispora epigaea]|uniref:Uncharacterized protein n=1 Tax=Diversispora epigaea TaxID=1348612 RepID=A0A397JR93_9GLOM|nr:hypothetical protein Glove_41g48 [Diversispora epigaea]
MEDQFDSYYGEKYTVKKRNKSPNSSKAQITQNWLNPFEVDFLKIEPNDVATILCRIDDLIIAYAILDTGTDSSMFTNNIPEYLGIKIDKKNIHKLTDTGRDFITVHENISVIPTKKDQNEKDISIMILVKGEFIAIHNGKTITISLSTHKEKYSHNVTTSNNIFNTEKKTNDSYSDTDTIKK